MAEPRGKKPSKWWQWVLMYPALGIAVIGAIPTFVNVYQSIVWKVPYNSVGIANEQNTLWQKNAECFRSQNFSNVVTDHNIAVGSIVCRSGDVLVKVQEPNSQARYRWIGLNTFENQHRSVQTGLLINEAMASEGRQDVIEVVQNMIVVCQQWKASGILKQRIRGPNGCIDVYINTYTGRVVSQVPAPCNNDCR